MDIWNRPGARKIREMIQYLKGAIRRPARPAPAPRQPQVSEPISTMAFGDLPIPAPPPPRPANTYALSPMAPPSVARRMSLTAEDNMSQAERAIVGMFDSSDDHNLSAQEEIAAYKEFMRLEGLAVLDPAVGGFCHLSDKRFVLERESRRALGHALNHPAGDLLNALMFDYERNQYHLQSPPLTFSQYIASRNRAELKLLIWTWLKDHNDDSFNEVYRRFEQGVRMLSPEKRKKYEVKTLNGRLYWEKWLVNGQINASSNPLCTSHAGGFFARKHATPTGKADAHAIWVLSKEKKLYTHASKLYRFHHSSFTAGDYIICAGEWSVYKGRLEWISAASGHYRPNVAQLQQAVTILANTFGVGANTYSVVCRDLAKKDVGPVPASKWLHESPAVLASKYASV